MSKQSIYTIAYCLLMIVAIIWPPNLGSSQSTTDSGSKSSQPSIEQLKQDNRQLSVEIKNNVEEIKAQANQPVKSAPRKVVATTHKKTSTSQNKYVEKVNRPDSLLIFFKTDDGYFEKRVKCYEGVPIVDLNEFSKQEEDAPVVAENNDAFYGQITNKPERKYWFLKRWIKKAFHHEKTKQR